MAIISPKEALRKHGVKATEIRPASSVSTTTAPESAGIGVIGRVSQDFRSRAGNIVDTFSDPTKTPIRKGFEATAQAFGAVPATALNIAPEPVRNVALKAGEVVGGAFSALTNVLGDNALAERLVRENPQAAQRLEEVLGTTAAAGSIAGSILTAGAGAKAGNTGVSVARNVADDLVQKSPRLLSVPNVKDRVARFLATAPEEKVQTILKETKPQKLDEYIQIAEKASKDPRAFTPYKVVGDKMGEALKLLEKEKQAVGSMKSSYVSGLRGGLDPFDSKPFINELVSVKNRLSGADKDFVQRIIDKAKAVKTKGAADRFIDDVQDELFKAGRQNVIPEGAALAKQVRSVVGKMNTNLKESLPPEYAKLNTRYSNLLTATRQLNRALGEVVDGAPTGGASLVKQFFSPAGTRAQSLFRFIRQKTGIDLAQDATLARFTMELFDDPRARSLLEGIPSTRAGAIERVIDFGVERLGVGQALQDVQRRGSILKAKEVMQNK